MRSIEILHALPGRVRLRIPELIDNPLLCESIKEKLMDKKGIKNIRINLACASLLVEYDTSVIDVFVPNKYLQGLAKCHNGKKTKKINVQNNNHSSLFASFIRGLRKLALPTGAFALTISRLKFSFTPIICILAAASAPVFKRALSVVVREKRLSVDMLDATALAIMGAQRNFATCGFMAWLISIGDFIRDETAMKSQKAIADLIKFHCDYATVVKGNHKFKKPIASVKPGDHVLVKAGDLIPVDGVVIRGCSGVDQRSITGESALFEVTPGDSVYAGSISVNGRIVIKTTATGINTRAGRIVKALRSAPVQETRIEDYAASFADRLVFPTFAASGAIYMLSRNITRALSMLIVDFGTGVRVAAPTAFLSFMVAAAQHNIIIKGGRAIEKLSKVDTIVFDKTGTLTTGEPSITSIISLDRHFKERRILKLAAAAESEINHPLANAIVSRARLENIRLQKNVESRLHIGAGVVAKVDSIEIIVGNESIMRSYGVPVDISLIECQNVEGQTPIFVAADRKIIGILYISDSLRQEAVDTVRELRELGIKDFLIATGDHSTAALTVAKELEISGVHSEASPEGKLVLVKQLREKGKTVAVVGDGINDTLALAYADVSIAPSGAADAAKEAADVILLEDNLMLIAESFRIAKNAMGLVHQNYKIVAIPNAGALALAASGLLGPPGATLINNGTTVAAGLNSLKPIIRSNIPFINKYQRVVTSNNKLLHQKEA